MEKFLSHLEFKYSKNLKIESSKVDNQNLFDDDLIQLPVTDNSKITHIGRCYCAVQTRYYDSFYMTDKKIKLHVQPRELRIK